MRLCMFKTNHVVTAQMKQRDIFKHTHMVKSHTLCTQPLRTSSRVHFMFPEPRRDPRTRCTRCTRWPCSEGDSNLFSAAEPQHLRLEHSLHLTKERVTWQPHSEPKQFLCEVPCLVSKTMNQIWLAYAKCRIGLRWPLAHAVLGRSVGVDFIGK